MKRFGLVLACVLAVAPATASAALGIDFVPGPPLIPGEIPTGEQYVDLVFRETGTPTNEGLFAYDLYITRDRPGAINLVRAERPDNWVFSSPGASFQEAGPEFSHKPSQIVINAIGDLLGANQDIADGTKAARIFYTLDPDAPYGDFRISLDPSGTLFVSGDTGEAIPVDISDSYSFIVIPEPVGLSLLGAAGLLMIRRRRAA
jgi:hypothetical protein